MKQHPTSRSLLIWLSGLVLLLGAGVWWVYCLAFPPTFGHGEVWIKNQRFSVLVARTVPQIAQGLSGRKEIGADGMLFQLPQRSLPKFWMKDMQFALDFIWIDGEKIVDITLDVPPPIPGSSLGSLPTYQPKVLVTHVLEVPAGFIAKHQLAVGDIVRLSRP